MKLSNPVLLSIALAFPASTAATPGVFKVEFNVHRGSSSDSAEFGASTHFSKREVDGVQAVQLINENTFYLANLSIGSNGQKVGVQLDTGSSDLWVTGSDDSICASGTAKREFKKWHNTGGYFDCSIYGTFDESSSTSFKSNNTDFYILYGDYTYASGGWGYDTVSIGSLTVENMSFAVANQSNSTMGVLGIGFASLEATYSSAFVGVEPYMYENFPMKLKSEGFIKKNIYSLYLNLQNAPHGSVLFGGVDHSKYIGSLVTLPIINRYTNYTTNPWTTQVTLDSVAYEGKTLLTNSTVALLDSGTSLTQLPSSVVSAAVSALGLSYENDVQAYTAKCGAFNDKSFTFTFAGVNITVPASNFFYSLTDFDGSVSSTCAFGIVESDFIVLGDSFLNAAYVVYDLDDYKISLANANFGESSNSEDIAVVISTIPDPNSGASTGTSNTAMATNTGSVSTTTAASSLKGSGAGHIVKPGVFAVVGSVFGSALLLIL
ncbi:hypothetical protein BABINDRAFT_163450 [Babjeviella inositovora NRRL Y-12698]|uniref:candidapepsin n=1 Tax=Babjeviella inositovora NRRL Y-12698 TaxID=984486 RepID=A0A1E3QI96_9ASCO|nr:uncharacterized protein BABINDRAFT_163450 [Babjeviella inositovora NRRL Y-12698]ODQ77425.1 hypothetical protein BABINDRAFT_163450 [Babjeviella inositovora NRRL Y-12698]